MSEWAYCVVGNITKTHLAPDGTVLYGSAAYTGGTKVYLCGKYWDPTRKTISVIGLNRYKRYRVNDMPPELIENVRWQRTYKPSVLHLMNHWEFWDCWWKDKNEDKKAVKAFVEKWNTGNWTE